MNIAHLAPLLRYLERVRPSWHDLAACRGTDVDFTARSSRAVSEALQVCGRCPVRAECLDWAIDIGDNVAVLGGTRPAERRRSGRVAA